MIVLKTNMKKIPENCKKCPFETTNDMVPLNCYITDECVEHIRNTSRHPNCPIIEISDNNKQNDNSDIYKTYRVPVVWTMGGHYNIKAISVEQAIEIAKTMSLPRGQYLEDSFEIEKEYIEEKERA